MIGFSRGAGDPAEYAWAYVPAPDLDESGWAYLASVAGSISEMFGMGLRDASVHVESLAWCDEENTRALLFSWGEAKGLGWK